MRKLFGTDGVRGTANHYPMTADIALKLGQALTCLLKRDHHKSAPKILIGKDTRLSCYMFEQALSSGICSMGGQALWAGPIPTPAVAFLTRSMRADAGVVISASHNHYEDNGIKFFDENGRKLPDAIELEIEQLVFSNQLETFRPDATMIGKVQRLDDARGRYIEFLKSTFPRGLTLDGLKIAVDCANGASYKAAPRIFEELGAKVFAYGVSPDGTNINDNCGSTYPSFIAGKTLEHGCDIGLAFDGDADRLILIDHTGCEVDGDKIMAICARAMHEKGQLKHATVVSTVMSNLALELKLKELGISLVRTAVGDRYVSETMWQHGYNLGGEQSGHLLFLDHNTTGDGILAALRVLEIIIATGRSLAELATIFSPLPQVLVNVKVKQRLGLDELPDLGAHIRSVEEKLAGRGRVLVRNSGTEPKVRVMLEGEDAKEIQQYAQDIAATVIKLMGAA